MRQWKKTRRAFTLIELIAVMVVLAILGAVAIPKYFDYASNARESASKGIVGGVRSGIANFYANAAIAGTASYPTLLELQTVGTVMQEAMADNPHNDLDTIQAATWNETNPPVLGTAGWNYDASVGRFWANSDVAGENDF